jgi:hypothetical protein
LDDVLQQSPDGTPPTGFPRSTNINGQELDYGMDPQIVNNATWGPQLKSALTQVPSISVVMNVDDLLGASQGIYTHASNHGRAWERPASVELIQPDGSEGFQINAGLRVRGGFSRSGGNPKHAFRLFFRDEYGQGKLEFPLFGNEGTDEFDGIDLRTAQNYSWSFQGDGQNTFLRDVFSRDVQGLMGQPYTRSRFYHLYINGQYWGLFQTQERSEASYAASYFGGDSDDYDVVKSAGSSGGYANEVTDGTMDAYERLAAYFYQAGGLNDTNMSQYWRAQGKNPDGTTNPTYERLLDVDNLIDYMIITYYTGDRDGPASRFVTGRVNNYFGIFNRENPDGFKFFEHDSEHSLDRGDANMVRPYSSGGNNFSYFNPHWMHEQLANNNSEYRQRFADRVHQHLFGDGVLAAENALQLVNQRAAEIDQAIIAESARWGDAKRSTPFTKTDWERAVGNVRAFITNRVNTVVRQFEQEGWYRPGEAPRFAVNDEPSTGGRIDGDDRISLFSSAQITYSPIVPAQSVWKYLASGQDLGTTWRNPSFNDAAWPSGPGQLGYGDGDEATVVPCGPQAPNCVGNRYPTVYFRHSFQVPDPSVHSLLRMRIQRDDGAAVYLNGVEVARSNLAANATYTTLATSVVGGSEESDWFEFEVDASLLRAGTNVLAVEVHQQSLSSSDLSFDLQLESGTLDQGGGNVYYTLDNTDPRAIGGTVATHAVRYSGVSFQLPGTRTVTARSFVGGVWGPMAVATFLTGTPASAANLRISEINYNPHAPLPAFGEVDVDNDEFEFIELTNVGNEVIDLNDVRFTRTTVGGNDEGIDFRFAPQSLMPGEFLVVAKNRNAFVSRYGSEIRLAESADHPLGTGVFEGSLSNAGETLTVIDAAGSIIQQLRYDDGGDWPGRADGGASSLEVVNFDSDSSLALSYQASILIGGSPGTGVMFASPGPVINEVLTHTDLPQVDAIELYNPTGQAWDISGWYLSDSGENLLRFRLPAGTVLGAGQYRVWDETQLGFGFRGQSSDDAWLIAADANGRPVRFVDHVEFDAAMNGVTLGRWPNGSGALFPQTANSLGRANSGPVPSSIVIAEVHYATDASGLTTLSATEQTFVELWNPSNGQRELSGWRVRGAVDFDFPVGTTLAAGERIVLVAFSPTSSPDRAAAFRARYPSVQQARLFGPFDGALERDGSTVRLLQPEDPLQLGLGFVLVDRVSYESTPPWPAVLASRQSLTRASATSYGDLPSSWQAAAPSPGIASTSTGTGDFDGNGRVDVVDVDLLCVEIRTRGTRSNFDVNGDASINFNDMQFLIQSILGTNFGDASLDGLFNSTDLIQVFQAGQYENAVNGDSTWGTGDWNCDGDFTTADLVLAFQGGAYVAVASPAEAREAVLSDVLDLHALAAASLANEEGSKRTRFGRAYTSEQDAPLATTAVDQVFEQTWQIV